MFREDSHGSYLCCWFRTSDLSYPRPRNKRNTIDYYYLRRIQDFSDGGPKKLHEIKKWFPPKDTRIDSVIEMITTDDVSNFDMGPKLKIVCVKKYTYLSFDQIRDQVTMFLKYSEFK